jgi:hypothetical protein
VVAKIEKGEEVMVNNNPVYGTAVCNVPTGS